MPHSESGGDILKRGLTFPIGLFEHFDLLGLRTSFIFNRTPIRYLTFPDISLL